MATPESERDQAKGRIKEAGGKLVGNKDLEREGKADRAAGKVKATVDKVKDAVTGKGKRRRPREPRV